MRRRAPRSTRFPSATLFRSRERREAVRDVVERRHHEEAEQHPLAVLPRVPAGDPAAGDNEEHVEREEDRERAEHPVRSEEHTSELQSRQSLACRLLLEKKKR